MRDTFAGTILQKRDYSIDLVGGILICHMILGHCILMSNTYNLSFTKCLNFLYFFMPWFFYKSGSFFHSETSRSIIGGACKRLLLPFIIFSIVGHLFEILNIAFSKDISFQLSNLIPIKSLIIQGSIPANLPLWFLLSLFIVRIISNLLFKISSSSLFIGLFACIFMCFAFLLFYNNVKNPLYLSNICTGIFFFLMGNLMKEIQYHTFSFIISIVGYLSFCICGLTIVDMRLNELHKGSYLFFPLASIFGIILINNLVKRLNIRNKVLEFIGKNSMDFYVLHWIIITFTLIIIHAFEIEMSKIRLLFSFLFANIVLLPVLIIKLNKNNYYKKAMGY